MMEDITIGVAIFVMLVILSAVGRRINAPSTDIWA